MTNMEKSQNSGYLLCSKKMSVKHKQTTQTRKRLQFLNITLGLKERLNFTGRNHTWIISNVY